MSRSETAVDTKTNIAWLKPEQVKAMRSAAYEGRHGHRDEAVVTLLYDTGLRRGELAQVDRTMLDLEDATLSIPAQIQKNYPNDNSPSAATFALDQSGDLETVKTLRSYLQVVDRHTPALFPSRKSDRMTGKGINDVVKRLAERAEVKPYTVGGRVDADAVTAHTLRHSVAYRMLREEDGNTFYDVRNRLRHATIQTTERKYDHFDTI